MPPHQRATFGTAGKLLEVDFGISGLLWLCRFSFLLKLQLHNTCILKPIIYHHIHQHHSILSYVTLLTAELQQSPTLLIDLTKEKSFYLRATVVVVALERACADLGTGGGDLVFTIFLFAMFNFVRYQRIVLKKKPTLYTIKKFFS